MYIDWYYDFWTENKATVSMHVAVTIFIIPLEIILFSVFTKKIYQCLVESNFRKFIHLFIMFFVFLLILQVLYGWKEYLDNVLTPKIQMFIRLNYMQRMIPQNHDMYDQAQIMNQIAYMPRNFYQNYDHVLRFWIPLFSSFFFYTAFIFWNDWKIGAVSFVFFFILLTAFTYAVIQLSQYSNTVYEKGEMLLHQYENVLYNDEAIKTYNTQTEEVANLQNLETEYNKERENFMIFTNLVKFAFLLFSIAFILFLFFYMYKKLLMNPQQYPAWKFITFITILFFMIRFIVHTLGYLPQTIQLYGSLQQLNTVDLKYPIDDKNPVVMDTVEQYNNFDISMDNVSFHYPTTLAPVLKNFSLKVPYRTSLLIKGNIGVGKSTIMKLLMRFYKPQKGDITLGKHSIYTIPKDKFTKLIYMMSQNTILFSNRTVLENILYNSKEKVTATELFQRFSLPSDFQHILNKKVIHHGVNVSGGQKRLILLLRCFFHSAKIFILDEPTDNLDENLTNYILKLLKRLQENHTVICISHDPRLSSIFSNTFEM